MDVDEPKRGVAGLFSRAAGGYDEVGFFHQVARRLLVVAGVAACASQRATGPRM